MAALLQDSFDLTVYSASYVLISFCIIAPPTEFRSAGLTIAQIFSSWLGEEDLFFVHHHVRRIALNVIVHSFLPFGYGVGIMFLGGAEFLDDLWYQNWFWKILFSVSLLLPSVSFVAVLYWSFDNWAQHPAVLILKKHGNPWTDVASYINTEFRRVDKFISATGSLTKTVVTDTWIVKISPYSIKFAHQSDATLRLVGTEDHALTDTSPAGVQYLIIEVLNRRNGVLPFSIRLNSQEFNDMKDKLVAPIQNVQNVVIHHTLSDRFIEAFKGQISQNPKYTNQDDTALEQCVGCMLITANVKLRKLCANAAEGQCQNCFCRPMWCVDCMGKWFASRQDQDHPETWLSSTCPCPTCRSRFCILDVCLLD